MQHMAILMGSRFGHIFKGAIEFKFNEEQSSLICIFAAPIVADLFIARDFEKAKLIAKLND